MSNKKSTRQRLTHEARHMAMGVVHLATWMVFSVSPAEPLTDGSKH